MTSPVALAACWLLTYAAHSTILVGIAVLLDRFGAAPGPRAQDLLWKGALVGGLLTATLQLGVAPDTADRLPAVHQTAVQVPAPPTTAAAPPAPAVSRLSPPEAMSVASSRPDPTPAPTHGSDGLVWVVGFWGLGAAAALGRRLAQRRRFFREVGPRRPVADPEVRRAARAVGDALGLRPQIRVTTAEGLPVPVSLGLREVCLPPRALTSLSPSSLDAALAHEAAHLARRDPLWLWACTVLEGLFFFQPLNRLARRRLQDVAEQVCDARAVQHTGRREALARCLVEVASWTLGPPRLALAGLAARPGTLETRVEHVLSGPEMRPLRVAHVLAGLALLAVVGWTAPGIAPGAPPMPPTPTTHGEAPASPTAARVPILMPPHSPDAPPPGDSATAADQAPPPTPDDPGLVVDGPVVTLDGRVAFSFPTGTSIRSDAESSVVSIYDASHGLVSFSTAPFDGAQRLGRFEGDAVAFSWEGRAVRVRSRAGRPILTGGDRDAYVRLISPADLPDRFRSRGSRWIGIVDLSGLRADITDVPPLAPARPDRPPTPPERPAPPPARPASPPTPPDPPSDLRPATHGPRTHALELRRPRVTINGRLVQSTATYIGADGYLFVNDPAIGLFIVGTSPFIDPDPAGVFEGRTLRFTSGGHEVVIESAAPIVEGTRVPAYGHFVDQTGGHLSVGGGDFEAVTRQIHRLRRADGQ